VEDVLLSSQLNAGLETKLLCNGGNTANTRTSSTGIETAKLTEKDNRSRRWRSDKLDGME